MHNLQSIMVFYVFQIDLPHSVDMPRCAAFINSCNSINAFSREAAFNEESKIPISSFESYPSSVPIVGFMISCFLLELVVGFNFLFTWNPHVELC